MKKVIYFLFVLFVFTVFYGFRFTHLNDDDPPGKKIFIENKCATCHSVEVAGITLKKKKSNIPDLSDVGARLDSSFVKKWILKEESKDGVKHMFSYKGSDEDLDNLVGWLMSLNKSGYENKTVQDSVGINSKDENKKR